MKRETIERIIGEELASNVVLCSSYKVEWQNSILPYPLVKFTLYAPIPVSEATGTGELRKTIRRTIDHFVKALNHAATSP